MTGPSGFLARAGGPARFRRALRRLTGPVRTYHRALTPLNRTRTRLPVAVLGGDMLGLLSRQLREALLQPAETSPAALRAGPRTVLPGRPDATRFVRAMQAELPGSHVPALPDVLHDRHTPASASAQTAVVHADAADRRRWPLASAVRVDRASNWRSGTGGTTPPAAALAGAESAFTGPYPALRIETLLAEILQVYYQPAVEAHSPSARADAATNVSPRVPPAVTELAPTSRGSSAGSGWPTLPGDHLEERMRAFVDSADALPPDPARANFATDGPPRSAAIENDFRLRPSYGSSSSGQRDLTDRLADVLRDQALQHGIDLT